MSDKDKTLRHAHSNELSSRFDLTVFGKGAIIVGCCSCLIEVAPSLGLSIEDWSEDAHKFKAFAWRLTVALIILRVMLLVGHRIGALVAAKSSSLLVDYIMTPISLKGTNSRWRRAVVSSIISKSTQSGGSWDIDTQFMELLMDEAEGFSSLAWILVAVGIAAARSGLPFMSHSHLQKFVMAWATCRLALLLCRSVTVLKTATETHMDQLPLDVGSVRALARCARFMIMVLSGLFILSNFGLNVSAALTGIGMTGILVGLSSQAVLADFFSWLVLITNRPFVKGDFVNVGDSQNGWVERISFLTTWIRTPPGDLFVFRNKTVTDQRIVNLCNVPRRRFDLTFEVSALCSEELLEEVPAIVKSAVEQQDKSEYCNCWIDGMGSFGPKFAYQFFLEMPDVQEARTASHNIWLQMMRSFKEKGIVLAAAERLQRAVALNTD